jgi:hypothetical protein
MKLDFVGNQAGDPVLAGAPPQRMPVSAAPQ